MRVLLDQGLPRSATLRLRDAGHEALHVGDLEMARATDEEILAKARTLGAVVITLDADFHRDARNHGRRPDNSSSSVAYLWRKVGIPLEEGRLREPSVFCSR